MIVQRDIKHLQLLTNMNTEPILSITNSGFLLSIDSSIYTMEKIGEALKVIGPDTCYYLLETVRGLEQANCALTAFTLLIGN